MSRPGWMVGGGAALALLGAAILLGPNMASGTAGPSISISPPSQNVLAGTAEINIEIKANNVTNLGAYDITMTFDPTVLEFLGAGDYGFLSSTGRQQTCFGYGQSVASVNEYKVLHAGCGTNGLLSNGQGNPGPSGSGTLAQVVFKAKGVGTSNLVFKGLGTDKYYVGAPDPSLPAGAIESAQTSLTFVEVCNAGNCEEQNIEFAPGTGVIQVIDPNAATPTALPPTPTPEPPSDVSQDDFEATVAAAVGTPRTLPTPAAGTSAAATATAVSQSNGTTAPGGGTTGSTGGVAGSGSGAAGSNGELPEGVTIGADGIPRYPDGTPVAGYGPQGQESNHLWVWGGVALLLWGLIAMGFGGRMRQRVQRDI